MSFRRNLFRRRILIPVLKKIPPDTVWEARLIADFDRRVQPDDSSSGAGFI
jgi:hypothetical protein